ncbi:MAG TPA: hypothetical protein VK009_11755, partial [Chloroflexota bacterium]|nr:hypothetical protein [Chloroflexota bacterium]
AALKSVFEVMVMSFLLLFIGARPSRRAGRVGLAAKAVTWQASITSLRNRKRCKGDDLIAPQRFQEGLKAAVYQASQPGVVDFNIADALGSCDLLHWRAANECHLNSATD